LGLVVVLVVCIMSVHGITRITDPKVHSPVHISLLSEVVPHEHFTTNDAREVQVIKDRVGLELKELIREEQKLGQLIALRNLEKKGLWFFNHDARRAIDNYQFQINEQKRKMEQSLEKVEVEWNQLKPYYGIYSNLFVSELIARLAWWLGSMADAFFTILAIETVFLLLVVGPLTLMFSVMWLSIGSMLLGFLFKIGIGMMTISTIFEMPGIMIRYHPTTVQFAIVYTGLIGPLVLITAFVWGWGIRSRSSSSSSRGRTKRD